MRLSDLHEFDVLGYANRDGCVDDALTAMFFNGQDGAVLINL